MICDLHSYCMSRSSHIPKGKTTKKQVEKFGPTRFPESTGKQELSKGKKEYMICKKCNIAYYDKSWHQSLADYKHLKEKNIDKKLIKFVLCPACEMEKNKQYEGIIIVHNFPDRKKSELMSLIKNMDATARRIDPLDRVHKIKETKKIIEIWTTENQLAKKIGNKIKAAFRKDLGAEKRKFSGEESDVVRVEIGS